MAATGHFRWAARLFAAVNSRSRWMTVGSPAPHAIGILQESEFWVGKGNGWKWPTEWFRKIGIVGNQKHSISMIAFCIVSKRSRELDQSRRGYFGMQRYASQPMAFSFCNIFPIFNAFFTLLFLTMFQLCAAWQTAGGGGWMHCRCNWTSWQVEWGEGVWSSEGRLLFIETFRNGENYCLEPNKWFRL